MRKLALIGFVFLAVAGVAGWYWGLPAYRQYKEQRALRFAQQFLKEGDYSKVRLSLQQVLTLNPTNLAACRMAAELSELFHSPAAVAWRRKVAELEPSLDNRLLLAASCLAHEPPPFPLASRTLESLEEASNVPAFHVLSADRAVRLNLIPEADWHLGEALRLEPTNQVHLLNLSVLRLVSTNARLAGEARAYLESASTQAQCSLVAARSLAMDGLKRKDWPAALRFAKLAGEGTNSVFADRLQYLSVLDEAERAGESARPALASLSGVEPGRGSGAKGGSEVCLALLEEMAATNANHAALLAGWLNGHGRPGEAVTWVTRLSPALQIQQPLQAQLAAAYCSRQQWSPLRTWLSAQDWSDQEFLRFAFLARALQGLGEVEVARINWNRSLREAAQRPEMLLVLGNAARSWGWTNQLEELLWTTARRYTNEVWPFPALARLCEERGDSHQLLAVYQSFLDRDRTNAAVRNNVAALSLLLNTNLEAAHRLARENFDRRQGDPVIASTYAFSLYRQGKTADGLEVFGRLKTDELHQPGIALYYALLLDSAGEGARAKEYREVAAGGRMLPEERALLQ